MGSRKLQDARLARQRLRKATAGQKQIWQRYITSGLPDLDPNQLAAHCVKQVWKNESPPPKLLLSLAAGLISEAGIFFTIPPPPPKQTWERITGQGFWSHLERISADPKTALKSATTQVNSLLEIITKAIGSALASDPKEIGFQVPIADLLGDPIALLQEIDKALTDESLQPSNPIDQNPWAFRSYHRQKDQAVRKAAGLDPQEPWGSKRKPKIGDTSLGAPKEQLSSLLTSTPFAPLLTETLRVSLTPTSRLEHMMFLAPSGWGKSRSLEYMICDDLKAVKAGRRSLIILESEGGLSNRIARHPWFSPDTPDNMADRLFFIDPGRPGYMPSLSFFDLANKNMADLEPLEREKLSNHVVDLYRYVFRALRGSELTEKQGYVFGQLVQMLVWVPEATFETLIDCLDQPDLAAELSKQAPARSQKFFEEKFPTRNFGHTREEIFQRLDTFRSSAGTFVRMVSGTKSNFDLGKAINAGSVVIINTSKEMLGEEASAVLGRFMIALLRLASLQRSEYDTQTFVYIDEAQEYLDEKSGALFQQARKRAIGLIIAHQDLKQVDDKLVNTIQTNTNIKICGNSAHSDRQIMAKNMNCSADFFTGLQKKNYVGTEFGLFARDLTPGGAVKIKVPYGTMEKMGLSETLPPGRWPLEMNDHSPTTGNDSASAEAPIPPLRIWTKREEKRTKP